jgi:hypothetical protein
MSSDSLQLSQNLVHAGVERKKKLDVGSSFKERYAEERDLSA